MKPLLAILIPTLYQNATLYDRVHAELQKQIGDQPVIIIPELDNRTLTTGAKRNLLLDKARALQTVTHVAHFDDDDLPGPNYIKHGMETVEGDYDCCELWGQYYENNKQMNPFHHSIAHDHWWQDDAFYYRNPNHLNFIKLSLLDDIKFQDKTIGEDGHFSIDLQKLGVLRREKPCGEIIYHYFAGNKKLKDHAQEPLMAQRRGTRL
jgi:hypothetical protein